MCITEHYLLQAKLLKVFHNFKLFEGKNRNQNMTLRNQLKNVKIQNAETRSGEECRSGDGHLD